MIFRKTKKEDLKELISLFDEARATIKKLDIDQWQDGYPQKEVLLQDILEGNSYVIEEDGEILGSFSLFLKEKTYDKIFEGAWNTQENRYLAVHRVAIRVKARGQNLPSKIFQFAENEGRKWEKISLRIDTHEGNKVMRRCLEKNGFSYCGVIFLENGQKRVAYEKRF